VREQGVAVSRVAHGRPWAGGCQALDLIEDFEGDILGGGECLLIAESEDLDAGRGEGGVTLCVVSKARLVSVLGAVDLDGELEAGADEVEGVGARGRLPPELGAEVPVAEDKPDAGLRVGRGDALKASEVDRR
jgi:hypothetical protein